MRFTPGAEAVVAANPRAQPTSSGARLRRRCRLRPPLRHRAAPSGVSPFSVLGGGAAAASGALVHVGDESRLDASERGTRRPSVRRDRRTRGNRCVRARTRAPQCLRWASAMTFRRGDLDLDGQIVEPRAARIAGVELHAGQAGWPAPQPPVGARGERGAGHGQSPAAGRDLRVAGYGVCSPDLVRVDARAGAVTAHSPPANRRPRRRSPPAWSSRPTERPTARSVARPSANRPCGVEPAGKPADAACGDRAVHRAFEGHVPVRGSGHRVEPPPVEDSNALKRPSEAPLARDRRGPRGREIVS